MTFFHLLKVQLPNVDISLLSFRQWFLCTSFPSPPDPFEDSSPLATDKLEEANGMSQNGMANFGKLDSLLHCLSNWNMCRFSHSLSHLAFLLWWLFLCVDSRWIVEKISKPSFIGCLHQELLILSDVLMLCMFIFWYPITQFLVNLIYVTSTLFIFIFIFAIFIICNPFIAIIL